MNEGIVGTDDIVAQLRSVEEQLRDLAFDRLQAMVTKAGDSNAAAVAKKEERKLLQARRGIEKAIHALAPSTDVLDE